MKLQRDGRLFFAVVVACLVLMVALPAVTHGCTALVVPAIGGCLYVAASATSSYLAERRTRRRIDDGVAEVEQWLRGKPKVSVPAPPSEFCPSCGSPTSPVSGHCIRHGRR